MNKWLNEWMIDWIDDIIDAELQFIGCDKGLCCFVNHSTERESFVHSFIQWFNDLLVDSIIQSAIQTKVNQIWLYEWI